MEALAPPGGDTAVGEVIGSLVADAPLGPEEIAAAVLEGLDRGEELILPDDAARAAYELKLDDRAAYDQVMRKQAARLNAMGVRRGNRTVTEVSELDGASAVREEDSFDVESVRKWLASRERSWTRTSRCSSSAAAPPTSPTRCATARTT